jgi:hypothetical protein
MSIRRLERTDWRGFCIRASRGFLGKQVEIEIGSLQIGFQPEARRQPLLGISYDPHSDVLELLVGELDHLIRSPREVYVDEPLVGTTILQIIDADGMQQIITLRDPLMLPAPSRTARY